MHHRAVAVGLVRGAGFLALIVGVWSAGERTPEFYAAVHDNPLRRVAGPGRPLNLPRLGAATFAAPALLVGAGLYLTFAGGRLIQRIGRDLASMGCVACGYDLRGISASACPECGARLHSPGATAS